MPITYRYVVRSTIVLLTVGLAALSLVVIATAWLSQRAQGYLQDVGLARQVRSAAVALRDGLLSAESSQRGFLLTGNEIYLAPYDSAVARARQGLGELNSMLEGRSDRKVLMGELKRIVSDTIADQQNSLALKQAGNDGGALAIIKTNKGKALGDEANVYLSALILESDTLLEDGAAQQSRNSQWLRWTSLSSAVVIILVVGIVLVTVQRYGAESAAAHAELDRMNMTLEARIEERTEELARAKDRAELLLAEVNHRVANSLSLVSSLVKLQVRALSEPAAKAALEETNSRILAIAQMHKYLFTTGNVGNVSAETYLAAVLGQLETSMVASGTEVSLRATLNPATVATSDAVYLGIVATEWVTNAFKYAYPNGEGEIRVRLGTEGDAVHLCVEDDGVGREASAAIQGTGFGSRVVGTIAGMMGATARYHKRQPGTEACLILPTRHEEQAA